MRLIDADALKERIKRFLGIKSLDNLLPAERAIVHHIDRMPTIQTEQRWIPVTERLPKFGTTVLITNEKGNVRCGRFRGVEFWKDDGDAYWTFKSNTVEHVLAWMPLPEPWEGEPK